VTIVAIVTIEGGFIERLIFKNEEDIICCDYGGCAVIHDDGSEGDASGNAETAECGICHQQPVC
jgi:hypothetical protein